MYCTAQYHAESFRIVCHAIHPRYAMDALPINHVWLGLHENCCNGWTVMADSGLAGWHAGRYILIAIIVSVLLYAERSCRTLSLLTVLHLLPALVVVERARAGFSFCL